MSNQRSKAYEALMICCETTCTKSDISEYLLHLEKIREAVDRGDFKRAKELSNE